MASSLGNWWKVWFGIFLARLFLHCGTQQWSPLGMIADDRLVSSIAGSWLYTRGLALVSKIHDVNPRWLLCDKGELGLSLWYGTIFLFLEQIAPSCAAHARTCCEDFRGCSAGKLMASEIPEMFDAFGPQFNTFMSVGILLQYFRRKLLQFKWSKTVSN